MPSLHFRFGVRQIEHELAVDMSAMSLRPEFESRQGRHKPFFCRMTAEKIIKQWWNKSSAWYQQKYKLPVEIHYGPGVPNEDTLKLLGSLRGKKVLELGCGGGQCSVAFAKKGAQVTGVDISEEQLKFAKRLATKHKVSIHFIESSFQNLKGVKPNSQDVVFSAWAFQYSPDLKRVFKKAYQLLKQQGLFVFCVEHPFLQCVDSTSSKITKSYFKAGKLDEGDFVEYQRKMSDLYNPLSASGFDILEIREPYSGNRDVWNKDKNFQRSRISKIPSTIIFKARKP